MKAGVLAFFQQDNLKSFFSQQGPHGGPCWTPTDDEHISIVDFHMMSG
jgi:hypothetical protein